MRTGLAAVAAAIAGGVAKDGGHHRHGHQAFHAARAVNTTAPEPTCGCTTVYSVVVGSFSLYNPPEPIVTSTLSTTSTVLASSTTTVAITSASPSPSQSPSSLSTSSASPVPTTSPSPVVPFVSTCSSTGVYTVPASTITVTSSTVECYTAGSLTTTVTFVPGTYTRPETVTTVTETSYVIFCPFSTSTAAPEPVATKIAPSPVAPAPVAAAITSVAAVIESVVPLVESITKPKPKPQPKPETSSKPPPSNGGKLGSSTNQWGITYTPYSPSGDCKTASEVDSDIASIAKANFEVVRVYSTDCSALENIGSACKANGLKMLLGVFITGSGTADAQEQVTDIVKWAQWSLVDLIVVGNEVIMSGFASASDLVSFISSASSAFKSAGYTGPVTTTEPLSSWEANHEILCPVVDIVGANIHAFFSSITDAAGAGAFVKMELDIANKLCPDKYAINLESGWPSGGIPNGLAIPGVSEQAIAIKSIKDAVGGHSVMFSFANDPWKAPGEFGCEQSWGAFHLYE